jgi:hypothetical protein
MADAARRNPAPSDALRIGDRAWAYLGAVLITTVTILMIFGRHWWCRLGDVAFSAWDTSSAHLSQHLVDPYSFTHVEHGIVFYALLRLVAPGRSMTFRFLAAVTIASGWEVLENSSWVIDRYREATIDQGYYGDSIANSLADIACCAIGFVATSRLRWWWSLGLMVLMESVLVLTIRDNLVLNVVMLIYSFDAILDWQAARAA